MATFRKLRSMVIVLILFPLILSAQTFEGFDVPALEPITGNGDWGLKIVVLNVGQADAILVMAPNGDVCLIDAGKTKSSGDTIVDFLSSGTLNGIGTIRVIDLLYVTYYDQDHIGGLGQVVERGIRIRKAFDQGKSGKRPLRTPTGRISQYGKYVTAVGDPNGNMIQDPADTNFVRHKIHFGNVETLGASDQVQIRCVAVRGDTRGNNHDRDLDPENKDTNFDENPGSIALVIRLGEFEFYTAGDQTDNDWKSKPAIEEDVLKSQAIKGGNDIDVLKVSHHGSDTSTSSALATELNPEVAIISTKFTRRDKLPKKIVLKQFEENKCYVLITGDGMNPDTQSYTDARTNQDDNYTHSNRAIFNNQGNVMVLVSPDGERYTVISGSFAKTFDSNDSNNQRDSGT